MSISIESRRLIRKDAGRFQPTPIVRSRAPLRVSFAGGGTDLPHWYMEHPGAVVSTTINRHAYVTLYPREDGKVRIRSLDLGHSVHFDVGSTPGFDGVLDLAKAVIRRLGACNGMDLEIRSDAPPGSGLGGSSALTAALIGAVARQSRMLLVEPDLAELNYLVERIDLGVAGGKQDQYATTCGGLNVIEFRADGVSVSPVDVGWDVLNDLESHLLLCYTGKVRADLGLVDRQVSLYRKARVSTSKAMFQLYDLVHEIRDAITSGRLTEFGKLLHEAYLIKKRINPEVADGTIADLLYERARACGAIGGKLLGAGGGGYLLLYCETTRQCEVRRALEEMGGQVSEFSFEPRGLETWQSRDR
jgi:D-glycero-alpha-D-manno-heptose-7-phosphate kinase